MKNKIQQLPLEEYHQEREHYSASRIKLLWKSPAHFKEGIKPKESYAFKIGNAFEALLLDDRFNEQFWIFDDSELVAEIGGKRPTATKAYKEALELMMLQNEGKIMLTADEFDLISKMNESAQSNMTIKKLLSRGVLQPSVFYERNGVKLKTRPDFALPGKYTVDIKTISEIKSIHHLNRTIAQYRYDVQAVMQMWGMEVDTHFWVFTEKEPPYATAVVQFNQDDVDFTEAILCEKLELLKKCLETNEWPGFELYAQNKHGIIQSNLPNF